MHAFPGPLRAVTYSRVTLAVTAQIRGPRREGRAGEGNRTLITSLEGSSSTIELHPRRRLIVASGFASEIAVCAHPNLFQERGLGWAGWPTPAGDALPPRGRRKQSPMYPGARVRNAQIRTFEIG